MTVSPQDMEAHILIIEDDAGFAELMASTLADAGYKTACAASGWEALDLLAVKHHDLIILDYTLPDMTGASLIERIRALGHSIPFIMVTGLDDSSLAVQMMKTGASDYIIKDISFLDRLPVVSKRALLEKDIRDRLKQAEQSLIQSEMRLSRAQKIARMGSWEWDFVSGEVYFSDELYRMFGISPDNHEKIELKWVFRQINPHDRVTLRKAFFDSARKGQPFNVSFRVNTGPEGEIVISSLGEMRRNNDGKPRLFSGTTLDITARIRAESEIQQLINFDSLTGLPNRNLLHDRLNQSISLSARDQQLLGVLYLDLDRFKSINETLGHKIGDNLLQQVSNRLKACMRDSDTLARLGGDEFAIVLSCLDGIECISKTTKKIQTILAEPFFIDSNEIYTTASTGVAVYPMDGDDSNTLLKHAELAMYQAKEQERSSFQFFSSEMNTRIMERMQLEITMRKAVERREFFLLYQPQIDTETRRMVGVEALLRWQHPHLGVITPDKFISLAEETGLIIPIGEWTLIEACRQNRAWQQQGLPPVRMAVNLSARQFSQHGLDEMIRAILLESGMESQWLELEITESTIMHNAESNVEVLNHLKEMGIHLAIDDFGTGYSSLAYLKHFPINRLKIDKSFVCDITTNPDDAAIAEIIVKMAQTLKLSVMAEGVETKAQMDFLSFHGCHEMQGYYFSRPVTADEITSLLGSENQLS